LSRFLTRPGTKGVSIYKSSDPPPPALSHFFRPRSSAIVVVVSSSSAAAVINPDRRLPGCPPSSTPRDSPPLPASRNPPSIDPPTPSPLATPSVRRRRPPERGRLPPRRALASGAPDPHTPRVGLLPILLTVHPSLRGSAAARRAPCRLAVLSVVASAHASTSSPRPAFRGASQLSSPTPVGAPHSCPLLLVLHMFIIIPIKYVSPQHR
jgi:hypothetical protein